MTIRTNIGEPIGKIGKTKALALALLVLAALAVMVLAPTQEARASSFPGANGKIVFSSNRSTGTGVNNPEGDFEIFSMNPDGTGLKQLTKNKAGQDIDPTYSSDGKKIAFRSDRTGDSEIFVMNSDGTGETDLTNNPGNDLRPSFAPDGKKILFNSTRTGNTEVFVMNSDGTGQTDLTNDPAPDFNATFSPKGDKIAFVSVRSGLDEEIFVMNSNGTGQTPLTANDVFLDEDPSFSPDGDKIAFTSNRDGGTNHEDFDIFVMNADGTGIPLRPTSSTARDDEPAFSPDGKKIAFRSTRDGSEDVFVMDASGANQTNITPNASTVIDREPDWQPVAATFTVTTDTDPREDVCDGTCSLREAIIASNDVPGQIPNNIKFNIPGSGVHAITPSSALPQITRPVVIDGYTQPGASPNTLTTGTNAALKIELNGTSVPGNIGLNIAGSSHSVIRGLVINRFGSAISMSDFDGTAGTADNRIEGNFLGTDPTGTLNRGNDVGVNLFSTNGNVVGGTTPAARNLISGNIDGIEFVSGSDDNRALGNLIGTTASGTGALGNDAYGVGFFTGDSANKIGDGTAAGANTIAFNGRDGIQIDLSNASNTGNKISRNSIFSNAGLGIDLIGASETDTTNVSTPNDPGDIDSGPNGLQNKPVLSAAKSNATSTTVNGNLNSTPNKTYVLQFFSNPSGNEGKKFIGQKSVTTSGSGNVTFTFSPASKVAVGQTITATATKSSTGDTSEFSAPRKVASS